jgi:hypothetical protein
MVTVNRSDQPSGKVEAAVDALVNSSSSPRGQEPCQNEKSEKGLFDTRRRGLCAVLVVSCLVLLARHFYAYGQDESGFPDGFGAGQAASKSHRVIFENAFVRVLEVGVLRCTTVPMHHHRWPSLLLSWDTGGKTPHIHYRRQDGSVRDLPGTNEAIHPGAGSVEG